MSDTDGYKIVIVFAVFGDLLSDHVVPCVCLPLLGVRGFGDFTPSCAQYNLNNVPVTVQVCLLGVVWPFAVLCARLVSEYH